MNFKRRRAKSVRAGCLLCKPHKIMGNSNSAKTMQRLKADESFRQQIYVI